VTGAAKRAPGQCRAAVWCNTAKRILAVLTITKPLSESEAAQKAKPDHWRGWFPAEFREAVAKVSNAGNPMIEVAVAVFNKEQERQYRDFFTASDRAQQKLRNALAAIGKLAHYELGEVSQDLFPGHACEVRLEVEKARGNYPARSVIVDYRAAAAEVVSLRAAG
jgi:hypothetical protein